MHEVLLELDGADSGVDLQGRVEVLVVGAGKIGEELRGPGAAVAAVDGEAVVDVEGVADRETYEQLLIAHVEEVVVVLDAVQAVAVGHLILVDENLVGAFESGRHDEAATLVVERGQDDGGGGLVLDAFKLRLAGGWADDTDDGHGTSDGAMSA